MVRSRSFLVPVGVALAALAPKGALAGAESPTLDSTNASKPGNRISHSLLALSHGIDSLRSVAGHSSHSSHASHASHFSGSVSPPSTPAPTVPQPSGVIAGTATRLAAHLTAGQEVPAPVGAPVGGSGQFTGTLNGNVLTWRLTLGHLSGPATVSYVHLGTAGQVGSSLFKVCGPCSSPASGKLTLTQTEVIDLLAGLTYINVGTDKFPAGEVRGQINMQLPPITGGATGGGSSGGGSGGHFSHSSHASHASHASHSSHFSSY